MGIIRKVVDLSDPEYFCNKSWTISFNVNTKSWISFHSYTPNWYIAENNFFYSGLNGYCDEFDFVAFTESPIPSTTTSTSTQYITTTTTTTPSSGCNFTASIDNTFCNIEGTVTIIVPPACKRPNDLNTYSFITGYTTIPDGTSILSTDNKHECCSAVSYINSVPDSQPGTLPPYILNGISVQCYSIKVGFTAYIGGFGTDCSVVSDGWYFTDESGESSTIFNVTNGIITEIVDCIVPTTTSTSTSSSTTTTSTTQPLDCTFSVIVEKTDCTFFGTATII